MRPKRIEQFFGFLQWQSINMRAKTADAWR
jgi:hypothetical protein